MTVQMNIDMVRYSEILSLKESGLDDEREQRMLQRFPPGHEGIMRLNAPATVLDISGKIIVWFLPDVVNGTTQVSNMIFLASVR